MTFDVRAHRGRRRPSRNSLVSRLVFRRVAVGRFGLVALLAFGLTVSGAQMAQALDAVSLTVGYSGSNPAANDDRIDLTAGVPAAGPGSTQQTLQQIFDNTKLKLTKLDDVGYPAGWTLSFSYDSGATWTTALPTTATGTTTSWDKVNGVKAVGNIVSEGKTSDGYQIATGSSSVSTTPPATIMTGSSGDGWQALFSPDQTRFYNLTHTLTADLDCNYRQLPAGLAAGSHCPGFPLRLTTGAPYFGNGGTPVGFDSTGTKFYAVAHASSASTGVPLQLACYDIQPTQVMPCTGYPIALNTMTDLGGWTDFQHRNGKLYFVSYNSTTASLNCVDLELGTACVDEPPLGLTSLSASSYDNTLHLVGDNLYFRSAWRVHCVVVGARNVVDPYCSGFTSAGITRIPITSSLRAAIQTDATGAPIGMCVKKSAFCFNYASRTWVAAPTGWSSILDYETETIGSRTVWVDGATQKPGCWDWATNALCLTPTGGAYATNVVGASTYTTVADPWLSNCAWTNGDAGKFYTFNTLTGVLGCTPPSATTLSFNGATTVPRMACAGGGSTAVRRWEAIQISTSIPMSNPTLSVETVTGQPIAGWTDVPMPALSGTPLSSTLSLTSLSVTESGQAPKFLVSGDGLTGPVTATAKITAVGDAPELCLAPVAINPCPTAPAVMDTTPPVTTTTVNGSGSVVAGGVTSALQSATTSVSIVQPSITACGGVSSISGRTGDAVGGTSGRPIAGVTVTLLSSTGVPVMSNGQPVTTTTAADGTYRLDNIVPGIYTVSFNEPSPTTLLSTTNGSNGLPSTNPSVLAVTGSATSGTSRKVEIAVGTPGVANALYSIPASASPDVSTGVQGAAQPISPLANDEAATGRTFTLSTLKLCGVSPVQTPNSCTQTTLTIPGEGTYTVNATTGVVTFTPLATFVGAATPVKYQVTNSASTIVNSTITPTVVGTPTATPNTSTGPINTAQTSDVLANDSAAAGANLNSASLALCTSGSTSTCTSGSTLTVADQGTYTVTDGKITFTPVTGFTGQATAVTYVVADSLGQKVVSTYTPSVYAAPTTAPDVSSGNAGVTQTIHPLANDSPFSGTTLVPASVKLCTGTDVSPNCTHTSVTNSAGTYTVDPSTGDVSFVPVAGFSGVAPAVTYSVTDSAGHAASSTITPTVFGAPTASPDTSVGAFGATQTVNPLANDVAGYGSTLPANAVRLCASGQSSPGCTATSVTTADGVYAVNQSTGEISFTPAAGFTGEAAAMPYQVTDSHGLVASSTYTPKVRGVPALGRDTSSGAFGATQVKSLLTNDTPGFGTTLNVASVKLCKTPSSTPSASPAETAPNCSATSLLMPEGTYTVNTAGQMTFVPAAGYAGTPSTLMTYQVSDSQGQAATATFTPTVNPPAAPIAVSESQPVLAGGSVSFTNVIGSGGLSSGTSLQNGSTSGPCLVASGTTTPSTGCVTTLTTADGSWTIDQSTGIARYTANVTVSPGSQTPVTYRVTDAYGQSATAALTPVVPVPPTVMNDTSTGSFGSEQIIDVLANDSAAPPNGIDSSTLKLCDPSTNPAQVPPHCAATSITTPEGVYSIVATGPDAGKVKFTPAIGFSGVPSNPPTYQVSDLVGAVGSGTITPTVQPLAPPTAVADTSSGNAGAPQVIDPIANDQLGGSTQVVQFNPQSVRLCATGQTLPSCSATSVTTSDGVYTVNQTTGAVTFVPAAGFSGVATQPVTYQVQDTQSHVASSTITPTVFGAPVAVNNTSSGAYAQQQTIGVLDNDTAGFAAELNSGSLRLCDPTTQPPEVAPNCSASTVTTADGTYTISFDDVLFTPALGFTGLASPATYQVADDHGQIASALISPTVGLPPAPAAAADATLGQQGQAQTVHPLVNDQVGATGVTLRANSVRLCATGQTPPNCSATNVSVPGAGSFQVNQVSGDITFIPIAAYTGTPAAMTYQVSDSAGQVASATYTPTVIGLPLPGNDASSGAWNTAQSISVLANDTTRATVLDPTSVKLCAATDVAPNCTQTSLTVAGQGTYDVDSITGVVTFTPLPSFAGVATAVTYSVTDDQSQSVSATITPTVNAPAAPVATPQHKAVIPGATVSFTNVLGSNPSLVPLASGQDLQTGNGNGPCLVASSSTTPSTGCVTSLTTADGSWTIVPSTGVVSFAANNSGVSAGSLTPVAYRVTDVTGQTATALLTPVVPAPPTLSADLSQAEQGRTQVIAVLGNDRAGDSSATLSPGTVKLCPLGSNTTCSLSTLTIAGEGTYTVNANGTVSFVPVAGFTGPGTQVTYQVADSAGQVAHSTLQVTVFPPPAASAVSDTAMAAFGQTVLFQPWLNDSAGTKPAGATEPAPSLVLASIRLCDVGQVAPNCSATTVTTADGTYTVGVTTGEVTFVPLAGFYGTVTQPVTYQINNDWTGGSGVSTTTAALIPTIAPPGAPTAVNDTARTSPGTAVTVAVLTNDQAGSGALVPSSLRLCGPGETIPFCSKTSVSTNEGVFTVDGSGQITFVPNAQFDLSHPASIDYVVADVNNLVTFAQLVVTDPPVAASVVGQIAGPGQSVVSKLASTGSPAGGVLPFAVAGVAVGVTVMTLSSIRRNTTQSPARATNRTLDG